MPHPIINIRESRCSAIVQYVFLYVTSWRTQRYHLTCSAHYSPPDPAPSLCVTSYTTQWKHCNICSTNVTIIYSYFASFHNSEIFSRLSHYSNKRKRTKCFSCLTSYKNLNFMLSIIKSNPIFMRSLAELLPTYKKIKCNCNCNAFVTLVTRRGQYLHSCSKLVPISRMIANVNQ